MYKPYGKLKSLPVLTYQWQNLSKDFVTKLLISTNRKSETHDFILVIIDRLTKIVYYELIKVTINNFDLAKA